MPPIHLSQPQFWNCGRDRCYLSRPQNYGREKHTFLRRGIPRPPICGREKPNIVVVKDLISSSDRQPLNMHTSLSHTLCMRFQKVEDFFGNLTASPSLYFALKTLTHKASSLKWNAC